MKKIFFLFLAILGLYIFRSWFGLSHLGGFDLPYFSSERLKEFGLLPRAWDSGFGDGIGDSSIKYLWIETYLRSVVNIFVNRFSLPWELVLRFFWFWPYLALAIFSPYFFLKKILPDKNPLFITAGVLVYSFNTYVLLLVSGGQMNLGIAYMLAPLVLYAFINELTSSQVNGLVKKKIIAGLVLALQVMFDLRMAYVTMIAVGVYFLIYLLKFYVGVIASDPPVGGERGNLVLGKRLPRQSFHSFLAMTVPVVIAVLLHSFWLLPQVMTKTASLPPGYDNPGWLSFLSWAPFSNAISLLHPNWPENIFGKVYFMRPEFLGIPILAFSSLFFLFCHSEPRSNVGARNLTQNKAVEKDPSTSDAKRLSLGMTEMVVYFALLGLLGAFLAKGVNGPFGEIYYWLFSHAPFFYLFRDPTKFYLLVALSYAVLIPFSLTFLADRLSSSLRGPRLAGDEAISKLMRLPRPSLRSGLAMTRIIIGVFIVYWFILLWPVFSGQVKGTLTKENIPDEYLKLEQLLSSDKKFSRTLWVPTSHRLSYVTSFHPAIPAAKLLDATDQDKILHLLKEASVSAKLQELAVGYVIIPYDFSSEIFLTKRRYDDNLRKIVKEKLDKLSYLSPITGFSNLTVYRLLGGKEHFYINDIHGLTDSRVNGLRINPTKYEVQVANVQKGDLLVFSESYDAGWKAKVVNNSSVKEIATAAFGGLAMTSDFSLNSFRLEKDGDYTLEVFYEPQKYVIWGSYISLATLALSLAVLLVLRIAQRRLT